MSNVARVAGQAANTLSKPLQVEEVFSTYLYTGNSGTQTITNGIDLSGKGGLTWIKNRSSSSTNHSIFDSESGATGGTRLRTNLSNGLQAFNGQPAFTTSSTGFAWNNDASNDHNDSSYNYASWTFRKAPKFFDVVTYTGDGVAGREIAHNLGCEVGTIIVKCLTTGYAWAVYHRSLGNTQGLNLNATNAAFNASYYWNNTSPTSTDFTLSGNANVNGSDGDTYVAYIFAHNDGDGDFGPTGDQDIIKCGSYTGTGATGNNVNLGFEPQWLMIKRTDSTGNWQIADVMRGMPNNGGAGAYQRLSANLSDAEVNGQEGPIPTSTGFVLNSTSTDTNGNGNTYIYIAIRRPTAVPESATEVFDIKTSVNTNPGFTSDNVIDLAMITHKTTSANRYWSARLASRGYLYSNATNAEATSNAWDFGATQFGHYTSTGLGTNYLGYFWKRAPKYMDVVAYSGNGTYPRNISHNLGVVPEMMWVKTRNAADNWRVYSKDMTVQQEMLLNGTYAASGTSSWGTGGRPTDSVFIVGSANTNYSGRNYIAYLFATLAGISKVGSVTHSGTTNVDCGFSAGASLVMLKRTDATGDWYWWDSTSGIVSGNDPYFTLNGQAAQVTNTDLIDPLSSGFTITSSLTAGDYIFYAIA